MTRDQAQSRLVAALSSSRLLAIAGRLLASMNAPAVPLSPQTVAADEAARRGVAAGSVLATLISRQLLQVARAGDHSVALERAAAARARVSALAVWQQLRAIGIAGLIAAAVDVAATLVDPSPASGYRWLLWGVVVVAFGVLVLAARPLATAYRDSRTRRHLP